MDSHRTTLFKNVLDAGLSVSSGVYAAIDPTVSLELNAFGDYEHRGIDRDYDGPADRLLAVSAMAGVGPREDEIAARLFASQPGVTHHPVAGFVLRAFAGWVEDPVLRASASSGGLTTWLLETLLERGDIQGVIHMKPDGARDRLFSYQVSRTVDELRAGTKSRYYPGELSAPLKEILDISGKYVVVAIPSIAYEVRLLQEVEPIYRERIAFVIGLICGHQKSARYAEYLGWQAGFAPGDLMGIDFRKKVPGLPANSYSTEFSGIRDGREETVTVSQEELYGTDWGLGFFKTKFSDFTEDALNETADVAVGDAWLPRYVQDGSGTNVLLVRNKRLLDLLEEGVKAGVIHLDRLPVEDVIRSQASLIRQSVHELPYRMGYLAARGEVTPVVLRRPSTERLHVLRKAIQRLRVRSSRTSHTAYQQAKAAGNLRVFETAMRPVTRSYGLVQRLSRYANRLVTVARSGSGPRN